MTEAAPNQNAALRESEDRYRDLVEQSLDLICTHDLEGRILSVNEAALRAVGFSREEILQWRIPEHLPPKYQAGYFDYIARLRRDGRAEGLLPVETRSGERRIWEYRNTLRTEGVPFPIVRGMAHDVTERVRAEKILRSSEARLQALIGSIDEMVFELDAEERYVNIWTHNEELLVRPRAELLGKRLGDVLPEEVLAPLRRVVGQVLATGKGQNLEYPLRVLGGDRWFLARITPIPFPDGSFKTVCMVVRDITARKHAEDNLRRLSANLLDSQDEERRRIAAFLHETTAQGLTALKMNLASLRAGVMRPDPRSEQILASSLELVEASMQEIRTLSYLLHPPLLDEVGLASAINWYAKGFAERSGIRVEAHLPEDFGRLPRETETIIFRMVQECLTNVHRHSGSSVVHVRLARTSSAENAPQVVVEVEDFGKGMAAVPLHGDVNGSVILGVGIAGMRERIMQLSGKFEIHSVPGSGTHVRAVLPVSVAAGEVADRRKRSQIVPYERRKAAAAKAGS